MPKLTTRAAGRWRPTTYDKAARSVEVVAATEQPVDVFDYERWEIVQEVLFMSGVKVPAAEQVPLLDSHDRSTVDSVLGSARDFHPVGDELLATVAFSDDQAGQDAAAKVREGHLTDFSVGYQVLRSEWVPNGETAHVAGQEFAGPVRVVAEWAVRELSLAPIGADDRAKARSAKNLEGKTMPKPMGATGPPIWQDLLPGQWAAWRQYPANGLASLFEVHLQSER